MEAKQVKDLLEAYSSIYEKKEAEKEVKEDIELDEDAKYDRNRRRAAQRAQERNEARARGQTGSVPGVGYVSPRPERSTYTDSAGVVRHHTGAKMPKKEDQKESYDLFDYLLEYLVAEGYADTNEAALAIMANMSEEWRDSIVDEENHPVYGRGGEQRRTQTPRQIGVKGAPHNIPKGGTTISGRDPEGKRLFTGNQDRGKGNKARRRAGKEVEDTRG